MRVAIMPTGRTEWEGLPVALGRLFPGHEFYSLPTPAEIASDPTSYPYPGFTSCALTESFEETPPESATDLLSRAVQEALGERGRKAADLVLIVDDVEPPNMDRIGRVVAVMRQAARAHLGGLRQSGHHDVTAAVMRQKVSFHLIAPMVEAWFFADSEALMNAGVSEHTAVYFEDTTDPEAFETADPEYLGASATDCPALATLPARRQKKLRPKWLGSLPRETHPKAYLQWLCRDPGARNCTRYSEAEGGSAALAAISWAAMLGRSEAHFALLRSLVEDLEDGLQCGRGVRGVGGQASPLTARSAAPREAVLRNL